MAGEETTEGHCNGPGGGSQTSRPSSSSRRRLPRPSRSRVTGIVAIALAGCLVGVAAAQPSSAPISVTSLKPTAPPSGWKLLVPASGTSLLWYPPWMRKIPSDAWSVSAALKEKNGTTLVYLNAGPKTGTPTLSNWPSFRLDHIREERSRAVHEDGRAFGVAFRGGKGTCVLDDYLTRVANNHFEELACLVRGKTADSVIVAAVLVPVLQKYGPVVQRAVEAYQVR